jgi:hypothetical protein
LTLGPTRPTVYDGRHAVKEGAGGRLIDIEEASLEERRIGALPIVNAFVERLGLKGLLDDYVVADPRASLAPSASLLVLLRSLVVERAPVSW